MYVLVSTKRIPILFLTAECFIFLSQVDQKNPENVTKRLIINLFNKVSNNLNEFSFKCLNLKRQVV